MDQQLSSTGNIAGPFIQLHRRGRYVAEELRDLPAHVRRQVAVHVGILSARRPSPVSLSADIVGLLNSPAVRGHVLDDWPLHGVARWGAVASAFVAEVRDHCPSLMGQYVQDLVHAVALTIRPVVDMLRLGAGNELRLAVRFPEMHHHRLSLLGPLAMFFLESVARAALAWDTLLDAPNTPKEREPFGWAPCVDSLPATLQLILLNQTGRRIRSNALLYCPLARYLLEMGMVRRVHIRSSLPGQGDRRRLFSSEYVAASGGLGPQGYFVPDTCCEPAPWESDEAVLDRRTGRTAPQPLEEAELLEAKDRLLAAARSLVGRYIGAPRPQVKKLALWAHVADVDPGRLFSPEDSPGDEVLSALVEAAMRSRTSRTSIGRLNASLQDLPSSVSPSATAFNSAQCRTYLTRLRHEFQAELCKECV